MEDVCDVAVYDVDDGKDIGQMWEMQIDACDVD